MNYSELAKHLENALNNCIEKECKEYLIFLLNFKLELHKISNASVNNEFPARTAVDSPNLI